MLNGWQRYMGIANLKQLKEIHLGWNDNTLRKHFFLLKNLKDIR